MAHFVLAVAKLGVCCHRLFYMLLLSAHGLHPEDSSSARQGAPLSAALYVPATADHHCEGECGHVAASAIFVPIARGSVLL